jgi:hypothetical protein
MTVQRELAVALESLDKALVLQQLHYYMGRARENNNEFVFKQGRWWVYNSYPQWKEDHFPFWSEAKIGRIFRSLEKDGLVTGEQLSAHLYDRRKWYTINYDKVDELLKCTVDDSKLTRCTASECDDAPPQDDTVMSETSSEPSSDTRESAADEKPPERDYLDDIHGHHKKELDKNNDRQKGYRDATEEEYRVCQRVANLWTCGKLPSFGDDIERGIAGANDLLKLCDGDVRGLLFTIDEYHAAQGENGPTITSPYSLRGVLPNFMAKQRQREGPIRISQ